MPSLMTVTPVFDLNCLFFKWTLATPALIRNWWTLCHSPLQFSMFISKTCTCKINFIEEIGSSYSVWERTSKVYLNFSKILENNNFGCVIFFKQFLPFGIKELKTQLKFNFGLSTIVIVHVVLHDRGFESKEVLIIYFKVNVETIIWMFNFFVIGIF